MKMEKTPRYTQRERNMVLGFAAQYKDVIENKRTDAESNRKKDEVWRQIAKEFNARVYHQRSSKQLRQLYKNMKLLLKKDLCGEGKGNRSFMDLLNTLSQQESVAQYITEQMSPSGYSNGGRPQKYDDDYDDSKHPSVGGFGDVIVIKSEDISDNDQSQNGGTEDMDDDDDDSISLKDIPEVCLEEEDDEIFPPDDVRPQQPTNTRPQMLLNPQLQQQQQQKQLHAQTPEVTIQNIGGIRVGSIGSMANLKALQNSASNATQNTNNGGNAANKMTDEQTQQHLLLNGLGLSAVQPPSSATSLPPLQRGANNANSNNPSSANQLLMGLNGNANFGHKPGAHAHHSAQANNNQSGPSNSNSLNSSNNRNDYMTTLAVEERKLKIELLAAQIDYWRTLTKKLNDSPSHNPNPSCPCHFPGKVNGLPTQSSNS